MDLETDQIKKFHILLTFRIYEKREKKRKEKKRKEKKRKRNSDGVRARKVSKALRLLTSNQNKGRAVVEEAYQGATLSSTLAPGETGF